MRDLFKEKNKEGRKNFRAVLYAHEKSGVWLKNWYAIHYDWHDGGSGEPFDDDEEYKAYLEKYDWKEGESYCGDFCYIWTGKEKELTLF